jgi:homoserine/homoserine lactone efflux protein
MKLEVWLLYALAALGLSLSPGPNGLLALTHGALYGWVRALATILGGAIGFVLVIALSLFGVGALLQTSVHWLTLLKGLGGAYLVWLGVQVWRSPPIRLQAGAPASGVSGTAAQRFGQGLLSAVTNPKGILFFMAFLPQFIDPSAPLLPQFAIMAGTFALIEILTELLIAMMAQRVSPWLARVGRRFNQVCGGLFILIGAALPWR